jgi:cell division protease FtsH
MERFVMDKGENKKNSEPHKPQPPEQNYFRFIIWIPLLLFWLWVWQGIFESANVTTIPYSEFKNRLRGGEIVEVSLGETEITGLIEPGRKIAAGQIGRGVLKAPPASEEPWYVPWLPPQFQAPLRAPLDGVDAERASVPDGPPLRFRTTRVEDPDLVEQLTAHDVRFSGVRPSLLSQMFWSWILPFLLIFILWSWLARRFSSGMGASPLNIGKSRAKLVVDKSTGVTFDDVAGCDEAKHELEEEVDFLKNPARYKALGASIPRGVLLVGPPGTGKTLLARAVAGEANVPFFSIAGSDFVEMFVGVGAARVRDLFAEAKKKAPCIVFIDEIDTVGRQRTIHVGNVNDEREQTLNQLLSEMDGFESNTEVIVLAATNRPEVLDPALLRPGRFDRQVLIDAPDRSGREAILKVHTRSKPLADDVDLSKIAAGTPGLSGADLANIVNEAALLATRRGHTAIVHLDLTDAVEKVLAGPERKSRRLGEKEKERVAYHETGHAIVAAFCADSDPVRKISIVPRGRAALGYTLQLPDTEKFLLTRGALVDRIRGLVGGRAAEELVFGEVSTGAENDLDKATAIAQQMVCFYGMGKIGLTHYGEQRPLYLVQGQEETFTKNCSPETARQIDEEIAEILAGAYADAKNILLSHRRELDLLAAELLKRETIEEADFKAILHRLQPATAPQEDVRPESGQRQPA